jgi:hypothetical protein
VESSHLAFEPGGEDDALAELRGHSIAYRIAFGPQRGRNKFDMVFNPLIQPPGLT